MIEKTAKESYIFWQKESDDAIPEPAILIERYSDTIALTQEDQVINLNYESLPELLKFLKTLQTKP